MKDTAKLLIINVGVAIIVVILNTGFLRDPRLERVLPPFFVSMIYSTIIGGMAWWLLPKLAPKFSGRNWLRWLQLTLTLAAISIAGGSLAFALIVYQPFFPLQMGYRTSMGICLLLTLIIGFFSYVVEEAKARVQASTLQLRTRELEKERALKLAADAKLRSLESRVHPHFLFNTLNSISSLVRSNPSEAEALIERLAALLRFSLDQQGSLVSLRDEIKITNDYLDIEKARFGERLRYRFEIPADLLEVEVPAMSIQTLAENSVKYAVGAQRAGAEIEIRAHRDGDSVNFEVSDTGPGFSLDSLPAGHGLDTLKERLNTLYGERSALTARRLPHGMEVAFRIPC